MAKTIVEELVGILGLDIDKQSFDKGSKSLANLKNQYERVASAAQKFAVAGAALAGFTVITNKLTAEQENLAAAVGISGETLEAYGELAQQAGLNTDNVVDLVEELNNKLGESKGLEEITAVKEATRILGLEFEELRKLSPEEQFFRVAEAAKELGDQQAAVSAADILLGGEANKFIGFLRTQEGSLQDLLDAQIRLNLLTKENRVASQEFNKSMGRLSVVFGSATKQLAALLGKGLKPVIDFIVEWVAENKELSQSIIKVFSVVLPAALAVAGIAVAAMTAKLIAMGLAVLASTWPIIAITAAIAAIGIAIGLIVEDIVTFIKHGTEADTMLGSLLMTAKELFDAFANTKIGGAIVDGISAAIDAIKNLIDWAFKLGEVLGGGIFNAISSISDRFSGFFGGDSEQRFAGVGIGAGGSSISNNSSVSTISNQNTFNIDATGMDSDQLNRAIDSRVGQQNALAASANSTGIVR